ncbi:hypothetical protein CDAR_555401 [Caerostris darwini]|uniref:Uncharacterized protein n=1 Tax=Caerostris darwini TaxID=1538125 RepID=A0AAV4QCN1_9ARAC|nr:hypothetical protein CDAR_555401 [Caerostris darwini]
MRKIEFRDKLIIKIIDWQETSAVPKNGPSPPTVTAEHGRNASPKLCEIQGPPPAPRPTRRLMYALLVKLIPLCQYLHFMGSFARHTNTERVSITTNYWFLMCRLVVGMSS